MNVNERSPLLSASTVLLLTLGLCAGFAPASVLAQEAAAAAGTPVAFPRAQIRAGQQLYTNLCSGCHGDQLAGEQESPPLLGAEFRSHWFDQPLSNLYNYIATVMPQDNPGSLTPDQYAAVTAFTLSKNGFKADDKAPKLPGDAAALEQVWLPSPAAAGQ